jgi:hypothetical protein
MLRALLMLTGLLGASVGQADAATWRAPTLADSFAQQWDYVDSKAQFNYVMCSRQAGKTSGAELRAEAMLCRPGTRVIYATLIRRNAKKLFWWPLLEGLKRRGCESVQSEANESDMMLWLPNGSFLQALSIEKMADVERIRGDQCDLFLLDECQAPRDDVFAALRYKIVPPMLMKRGGAFDAMGTVPDVDPCEFTRCIDSPGADGRLFGWTCFDNPFIDHADIHRTAAAAGLTPGHPVYEREFLGRRVRDPDKMAYEFDRARNTYDPTGYDFTGHRHVMGIDLGFQDRDAIVVGAWNPQDPERRIRVRYTWQQNHQDVDQLAEVVKAAIATYHPSVIVGDHGGHGAVKVMKTLEARLGIVIQAKPGDVMVSVGLVNDDLRTGRLLVPRDSELCDDLEKVQRSVKGNRVEINKVGYHSDLSEALRYMHAGAWHYRSKAAAPEKTLDELRVERLAMKQRASADPWASRNYRRQGR